MTTTSRPVASSLLVLSCLASVACSESTAPAELTYAYTIFFSDSGPRNYAGSGGGFTSYNAAQSGDLWVAEYFLGDSIDVFEFLPTGVHCPTARSLTLGTAALGGTALASVAVRHGRLGATYPLADSSALVVDTMVEGRAWGHFSIQLAPASPGAVTATIVGWVALPEIDRYGIARHCG
jgi:hypothetical protein